MSDGVCEAMNKKREMFGDDRLREAFANHANNGEDVAVIGNSIFTTLDAHCDGLWEDDATLIVARYVGYV